MKLAWINGTEIRKGIRYVKTLFGKNSAEITQSAGPFGFESNPSKNFIAIISNTSNNGQPVIIGYIKKEALESLNVGDSMQYSTDAEGVIKSTITLRADGTAEILGTGDFMVRYSALETAFNDLQQQWNTFATAYVPGGPTVQGLPPNATNSNADITKAKIEEIKTI